MVKGSIEWEYEKEKGLVLHISPAPIGLLGGEVYRHAKAARKEMLLTLRSVIDLAIAKTDEKQDDKGATKIKVE